MTTASSRFQAAQADDEARSDPAAALTRHAAVHELVATFQAAEADVRRAFAIIVAAENRLNAVYALGEGDRHALSVEASRHGHGSDFRQADEAITRLAREAWGVICERLEIRRLLSVKRSEELNKRLRDGELPAITLENVADFAQFYLDNAGTMLAEAVTEVFNFLRPWRDTYKTNSREEIGPKVVLEGRVEKNWIKDGYHVRYNRQSEMTALDNVFSMLDGRGSIAKSYYGELHDAIGASGASGRGETRYFRFRCFKKGTLHLQFLRLDLLQRLNEVAGGQNLKTENAGVDRERSGLAVV